MHTPPYLGIIIHDWQLVKSGRGSEADLRRGMNTQVNPPDPREGVFPYNSELPSWCNNQKSSQLLGPALSTWRPSGLSLVSRLSSN